MEVRDARPDDAESIARLNAAAWRIAFQGVVNDTFLATHDGRPAGRRVDIENLSADAMQLVALDDGPVVGWAAAQPCRDDDCDPRVVFEIGACYVAPNHWRRGVGRLLMNVVMERARRSGQVEVRLWTARDTPASHGFYRSMQFETDGGAKTHALSDGSTIPIVRFARAL